MIPTSSRNRVQSIAQSLHKRNPLLADIANLIAKTNNYHRHYSAEEIISWFETPIAVGQYIEVREDGNLVGFITYAFLGQTQVNEWLTKKYVFEKDDWRSGNQFWIVDCIAPKGHGRELCSILRQRMIKDGWKGKTVYYRRMYRTGKEKVSTNII